MEAAKATDEAVSSPSSNKRPKTEDDEDTGEILTLIQVLIAARPFFIDFAVQAQQNFRDLELRQKCILGTYVCIFAGEIWKSPWV